MGKILNLSILLTFVAAVIGGDADENMDVITASNFHKFLQQESRNKDVRVGRGLQDQAFVVGTGYKVSDGVLDGSYGGVTHTAKGVVLGYDHEGPHHITNLRRGHHHNKQSYKNHPQQAPMYYTSPYGYNTPKMYESLGGQKYAYYDQGSKYGGGYNQPGYGYGYDSPSYGGLPEYGPALGDYGDQRSMGYNNGIGETGSVEQSPRPASYNRGVAKVYHSGNHLDSLRAIYGQNSYAFTI